jgi:hypothetical protein
MNRYFVLADSRSLPFDNYIGKRFDNLEEVLRWTIEIFKQVVAIDFSNSGVYICKISENGKLSVLAWFRIKEVE